MTKTKFISKIGIVISLLLTLQAFPTSAQNTIPTKGKEFWLGYIYQINDFPSSRRNDIFITSDVNTSGTISIPNQGYSQTFTVAANVTTTLTLPTAMVEANTSDIIQNRGILIQTDDTVSVFSINFQQYSADGTKVLPIQSLGTNYSISSYEGIVWGTINYSSEFVIVATEDNTEIQITPTALTQGGRPANVPYTVTLNRGNSYQVVAASGADDLTGSTIKATGNSGSCRTFAVFSGTMCTRVPAGCTACDHLYEQEYPVETWGKDYLMSLFSPSTSYTYKVLATQNGTQFTMNGVSHSLNAGQSYEENSVNVPGCIKSNKSISVSMFMEGKDCSDAGDPAMLLLNPNDQKINNVTFSTVASTVITNHYANVIMNTAHVGQLTLDGTTVNTSIFNNFPSCGNFVYANIPLTQGSHTFAADSGFIAYIYGIGGYETYAYSVGSFSPVPPKNIDTVYCTSSSVTLSPPINLITPVWTLASDSSVLATTLTYTFTPTTAQTILVTGIDPISGCQQKYYFTIALPTPPAINITTTVDTLCAYQSIQLNTSIDPPSSDYTYTWTPAFGLSNPNIPNPVATPLSNTMYHLLVSSPGNCSYARDSVMIYVKDGEITKAKISASKSRFCIGDTAMLGFNVEKLVEKDNFNNGTNSALWSAISLGTTSTSCGALTGNALYFNGTGTRSATTNDFNVLSGGSVSFYLKIGSGAFPCDDAESGENVVLEYSINSGASWTVMTTCMEYAFPNFKLVNVVIPPAASTVSTRFRWRQLSNSGGNQDNWALDEVYISKNSTTGYTYSWSPAIGLSSTTVPNPIVNTTTSRTYYLTINDPNKFCTYIDSIKISVGPNFNLTTPANITSCNSGGVRLYATPSVAGSYTYLWSPASSLSSATSATPNALPNGQVTYSVIVKSYQGCTKTASVTVNRPYSATFNVSPDRDSLCTGESVQLTSSAQLATCVTNAGTCTTNNTAQVGSNSSSINSVFSSSTESKSQYIITKAMLNNAGINQASTLTQIGFNISTLGSTLYKSFSIKIACTTDAFYSTTNFIGGTKTVFTAKDINLTSGVNYFNFDNTFNWDGNSNIVIEMCYSNTSSNTANFMSAFFASSALNRTFTSSACNASSGNTSSYLPVTYFKYCTISAPTLTYSWTPATGLSNPSIANPVASPTTLTNYILTATDAQTGCQFKDSLKIYVGPTFTTTTSGTVKKCNVNGVQINAAGASGGTYTYKWTPSNGLSSTTIANPIANPTISTKYYVYITSSLGCTRKDSVMVNTVQQSAITLNNDTTICSNTSLQIQTNVQPLNCSTGGNCSSTSDAQIGNGSSYLSLPFYSSSQETKTQYIITKAQLNASGITQASTLSQLGFNIASLGKTNYQNFTIRIACTSMSTYASNSFLSGTSTVFNPKNINLTSGINYFVFDNNYLWDGNSNLIVEICYSNTSTGTTSSILSTYYGTNVMLYYNGTSACGTATGYTNNYIPNTYFKYCPIPTSTYSYSWTPATGLSSTSIPNPVANPSTTTKYILTITHNQSGCELKDSVKVTVGGAVFATTTSGTVKKCSTNGVQINASVPGGGSGYSYQWTPATSLSSSNIANPIANPSGNIKYYVYVTSSSGCIRKDSVTVNVAQPYSISLSNDTSICTNTSLQLQSNASSVYCVTGGGCTSTNNAQVGTNTSTISLPFYSGIQQTKTQYILTKAQLNAAGITQASTLSELGLNISSLGKSDFQNFTIRIGCTSLSSYPTSIFLTGTQTVFNPKSISLTSGINYFVFDNSYLWDGNSNLIIEICYNNTNTGSFTYVYYTSYGTTAMLYNNGASACSATTGSTNSSIPNTYFKYCTVPSSTYSYSWSPASGLSSTTIPNPVANPSATTKYFVTITNNQSGCEQKDSVKVTVGGAVFATTTSGTVKKCSTTGVQINASVPGGGSGYSYQWTPATSLSSSNIANPIANPSGNIKYYVYVTSSSGCIRKDSVTVNVAQPYSISLSNDTSICTNTSLQLQSNASSVYCITGGGCTSTNNAQVGTSSSTYSRPFYSSYAQAKTQYILTKTQLNSAGITGATTLSQIGFNISSIGRSTYQDFSIRIGCTTSDYYSTSTFLSGLQTVFNPKDIAITTGVNYFVFDNSYIWDGNSNLVIEICFNNTSSASSSFASGTSTSNSQLLYNYGTNACATTTGFTSSFTPNTYFKYCSIPTSTYSYSWTPATGLSSTSIPNPVANPSATTKYFVTITNNQSGCELKDSVKVTVGGAAFATTTSGTVKKCSTNGVQINASVPGGGSGYSYQWTPATSLSSSNIANPIANPSGNIKYYVYVTSSSGCIRKDSVTVNVAQPSNLSLSNDTSICTNTSLQLLSNASPAYCITGANCTSTNNAQVGTSSSTYSRPFYSSYAQAKTQYILTKTQLNSAGITGATTLSQIGFNIASIGRTTYQDFSIRVGCATSAYYSTSTFLSGLQTVFNPKDITITTGVNYFVFDNSYIWDGNSNLVIEICFNNTSSASSSFAYGATTSNAQLLYNYGTNACATTTGLTSYFTPNTYFRYCSVPINTYSYSWSPSTGLSSTTIPNPIANSSTTTKYLLTVTHNQSGCQFIDSVNVNRLPIPAVVNLGADITSCSTVTLNAGNQSGVMYLWSTGAGTQTINVSATGTYHVKVSNSCGSRYDTIKYTRLNVPAVNLGPNISSCTPQTLSAGSQSGVRYQWNTGDTTSAITVGTTGTYFVKVSNACGSRYDTIQYTRLNTPSVNLGADITSCNPQTVSAGNQSGVIYQWNTGAATSAITMDTSGTYIVTISNSCGTVRDTIVFTRLPQVQPINLGADITSCNAATLNAGSQSGVTYLWNTGANSQTINVDTTGTYYVKVTNSCGSRYDTIYYTRLNTPSVNLGADITSCNPQTVSAGNQSGVTYQWNTGAATSTITMDTSGTYIVTISNSCGSVRDTISFTRLPQVQPISLGTDITSCDAATLNAGSQSGVTYLWNTGANTQTINVDTSGTYYVKVTNSCGSRYDTIVYTRLSTPNISLGTDISSCTPQTISAGNQSGVTYLWNTGDTTSSITVNATGTYIVIATGACSTVSDTIYYELHPQVNPINLGNDIKSCEAVLLTIGTPQTGINYLWNTGATSSSITVNTNGIYYLTAYNMCGSITDTINYELLPQVSPFDLGDNINLCSSNTRLSLNGTIDGNILWSTGDTTQVIDVYSSGQYWASVINSSGCSKTDSILVNLYQIPSINLDEDKTINACSGEGIVLDASANWTTVKWSDGSVSQQIIVNKTGKYWVEVTDANNCSASDTINVSFTETQISTPNVFTPNGDGLNEAFMLTDYQCIKEFNVTIYDRWGKEMYESDKPDFTWDGGNCSEGVYYFIINYSTYSNTEKVVKGWVQVLR